MKFMISTITLFFLVCISHYMQAVKTVYIPRSQGHAPSMICLPAYDYTIITSLNYAQSYKGKLIARDLFGSCVLNFTGSQVTNRSTSDLLADNFGLAPNFESSISFKPYIKNVLLDFYCNMPLDRILSGLYVNFKFPVNYAIWALNPCENVIQRGSTPFANGYMGDTLATYTHAAPIEPTYSTESSCNRVMPAPSPSAPAQTASAARAYFEGNVITGDILRPLSYNKISWCPLKRTELAELIIRLGRNLVCSDYTYLSVFGHVSFPTGNKQGQQYLFEPVCGNGKFYEVGLGTQGQYRFTAIDNPTDVIFLWDVSGETLLQTQQLRTFDLSGKDSCEQNPLSRYLLLKKINKNTAGYDGELIEASYVTTFPVFVSRPFQGDIDLKLSIEHKGFTQNFGFALWGTTAESLCPRFDLPTCPTAGNYYSIKGTTGAYNYITSGTLALGLEPLNATESQSTIFATAAIDNPVPMPNTTTYNNVSGTTVIDPFLLAYASAPPRIIECVNIDIDSARSPAQITYAFITETGYKWGNYPDQSSIVIGGSIETASNAPAELHQWSVWIKGSVIW